MAPPTDPIGRPAAQVPCTPEKRRRMDLDAIARIATPAKALDGFWWVPRSSRWLKGEPGGRCTQSGNCEGILEYLRSTQKDDLVETTSL